MSESDNLALYVRLYLQLARKDHMKMSKRQMLIRTMLLVACSIIVAGAFRRVQGAGKNCFQLTEGLCVPMQLCAISGTSTKPASFFGMRCGTFIDPASIPDAATPATSGYKKVLMLPDGSERLCYADWTCYYKYINEDVTGGDVVCQAYRPSRVSVMVKPFGPDPTAGSCPP